MRRQNRKAAEGPSPGPMRDDVGVLIALRNVAIIALLALGLTVVPGGGNLADALLTALSLIFLASVGLLLPRFWQQTSLTRDVMTDRQRWSFFAGLGLVALMIAGTDELLDTGPGFILWIALLGGGGFLAFDAFRQADA